MEPWDATRPSAVPAEVFMTAADTTLPATNSAIGSLRPQPGEYAPYYDRYVSLVPKGDSGIDILSTLDDQRRQTLLLLCGRTEADGDFRYAPGKWSLKEVLGHLNDTERIFSYRALRISRADKTPIEGFEQDDYVRNGPFGNTSLADLIEDYIAVRRATISLFRSLDEPAWSRRGTASNNEVTVRALAYIIAGHELHHRRIIEEKYVK
jgi:DinB superfamily